MTWWRLTRRNDFWRRWPTWWHLWLYIHQRPSARTVCDVYTWCHGRWACLLQRRSILHRHYYIDVICSFFSAHIDITTRRRRCNRRKHCSDVSRNIFRGGLGIIKYGIWWPGKPVEDRAVNNGDMYSPYACIPIASYTCSLRAESMNDFSDVRNGQTGIKYHTRIAALPVDDTT